MTSITWAGPRCVQEAAAILAPQNRTQGRCVALVVLPVLECRSPGTSREVQNSNDGNITKQRGEASEPTNHPPDTATLLGADWVRCPVLCAATVQSSR